MSEDTPAAETATYVSPHVPKLVLKLDVPGREGKQSIEFGNANFKTDEADLIAAIDHAIATNPGIRRRVSKVDRSAAEALARAHMAKNAGTVANGGVNSANLANLRNAELANRDAQLAQASILNSENISEQLKEDNLVLTTAVDVPAGKLNLKGAN